MSAKHDLLQRVFYPEEQANGKTLYLYEHDGQYGNVLAACNELGLNFVNRDRRLMVAGAEFTRAMASATGSTKPSILKKPEQVAPNTALLKQDIRGTGTISLSGKHKKLADNLGTDLSSTLTPENLTTAKAVDPIKEDTKPIVERRQERTQRGPHQIEQPTASESSTIHAGDTASYNDAMAIRLAALENRELAIKQREAAISAREGALEAGAAMPTNLQGASVDLAQLDDLKSKEKALKRQLTMLEEHQQALISLKEETQQWLQQVS